MVNMEENRPELALYAVVMVLVAIVVVLTLLFLSPQLAALLARFS